MNNFSTEKEFFVGAQKMYFDSSSEKGVVFFFLLFIVCLFQVFIFSKAFKRNYTHTQIIYNYSHSIEQMISAKQRIYFWQHLTWKMFSSRFYSLPRRKVRPGPSLYGRENEESQPI